MTSAIRLDPRLIHAAALEARMRKRSIPKQIEYWAEIGKQIDSVLNLDELMAISQGLARLRLEPVASNPVNPEEVFQAVRRDQQGNRLKSKVSNASVYYEVSESHPGMLARVRADGCRETGQFRNGKFTLIHSS